MTLRNAAFFLLTTVLLLFAQGRWAVAAIAWIAPVLLVRY